MPWGTNVAWQHCVRIMYASMSPSLRIAWAALDCVRHCKGVARCVQLAVEGDGQQLAPGGPRWPQVACFDGRQTRQT